MTMRELRRERVVAGVSGRLLCARAQVDRARLSAIERGYFEPTASEMERLEQALSDLIRAKQKVAEVAAEAGWPLDAV